MPLEGNNGFPLYVKTDRFARSDEPGGSQCPSYSARPGELSCYASEVLILFP